jgi:glycosyltransferase involved in cell wall biosynthesis
MHPSVSIIIPTKNRTSILTTSLNFLLPSLQKQHPEIIVVNDGEDVVNLQAFAYPRIRVVKNRGKGVASARNTGATISTGDILLFLDDDMLISEEAIEKVIAFHLHREDSALNLNWVYPPDMQRNLHETLFGRYLETFFFTTLKGWSRDLSEWNDHQLFQASGVTSQNLSLRRDTFLKIGGYNESFPHAGFEDFELARKLNTARVSIYVDPTVMTFHNEADRLTIQAWLDRKYRGSITRSVAVDLGYTELSISYSTAKKMVLQILGVLAPALKKMVSSKFWNTRTFADRMFFVLINLLLAEAIYRGYTADHSLKKG